MNMSIRTASRKWTEFPAMFFDYQLASHPGVATHVQFDLDMLRYRSMICLWMDARMGTWYGIVNHEFPLTDLWRKVR